MGLRISRTEKNIRNAFIKLHSKKPLEKITVKELSEAVCINRTTFYRHYSSIYALSEIIYKFTQSIDAERTDIE